MRTFKARLMPRIRTILKLTSTSSHIEHDVYSEWLYNAGERLVTQTLMPDSSSDPMCALHRTFHHIAFLHVI